MSNFMTGVAVIRPTEEETEELQSAFAYRMTARHASRKREEAVWRRAAQRHTETQMGYQDYVENNLRGGNR